MVLNIFNSLYFVFNAMEADANLPMVWPWFAGVDDYLLFTIGSTLLLIELELGGDAEEFFEDETDDFDDYFEDLVDEDAEEEEPYGDEDDVSDVLFGISVLYGAIPFGYSEGNMFVLSLFFSLLGTAISIFCAIQDEGVHAMSVFLPIGTPLVLAPFIILLEFISFLIRPFSLTIRLFANTLAGHMLVGILMGICWSLLTPVFIGNLLFFVFVFILGFFMLFEMCINLVQTMVFCYLSEVYDDELEGDD